MSGEIDKERLARLVEESKSWPAYKKGELGVKAPSRIDSNSAAALYRQVPQLQQQLTDELAKLELLTLAYVGEHHFPDRTYKASLEELVTKYRELERRLFLMESQRSAAIGAENRDASKAFNALVAAHFPTPEETYGNNSSWAISDLCRALAAECKKVAELEQSERVLVRASSLPAHQLAEVHLRNEQRLTKRIAELERQLAEAKKALGQMRVICENREMSTLAKAGEMLRISLEGLEAIDAARKERG